MISWFKKNKDKKNKQDSVKKSVDAARVDNNPLDIACSDSDPSERINALKKLSQQADFAKVVEQGKYPDVRLLAAKKLEEEAHIRTAYAAVRQKDKTAAKVLKAHISVFDKQRAEQQKLETQISKTLAEAETLASSVWSPSYNARYQVLLQNWQQFQTQHTASLLAQFNTHEQAIKATLEANRPRVEAPRHQAEVCELLESICIACQHANLIEAQIACTDWAAILAGANQKWSAAAAIVTPDEAATERFNCLEQSLSSAITLAGILNEECQAPDDFTPSGLKRMAGACDKAGWFLNDKPVWFNELADLILEVKQNQQLLLEQQEEEQAGIHKLFASLRRAIKDGRLIPAKSISSRLEAKLNNSAVDGIDKYHEQLESLNQQLSQLIDWNAFATSPKYEELCEQMEALQDNDVEQNRESVDAHVEQIKYLQNLWKELGRSDSSEHYWERFQDAGNKAYEPAQYYFDEQRKKREDNLLKRFELCEQLTQVLEAAVENNDWKSLEKQLFISKRDWGKYRAVDRKAGKDIQERFDHLIEQAKLNLQPQYDAAVGAKEALIAKVGALAEKEINQHLINQTKELQAAWKAVGMTPRDKDQQLWEQFNGVCRKIFQADKARRDTRRKEENSHFDLAKQYIDEVKALELTQSPEALTAIQQQFAILPFNTDDRGADKLKQAFENACTAYEQQRDALESNSIKGDFAELIRKARLCHAIELNQQQDDLPALLEQWGDKPINNALWHKAIEKRKSNALDNKDQATKEYTTARQLLCVRLEILLDVESPSADKAMRMEYQLEQLQNRNRKSQGFDEILEELAVSWFVAPPANADVADELESRFQALYNTVK